MREAKDPRDPNTTGVCRGCGRPVSAPFRAYRPDGKVYVGCVDADHTGHLHALGESKWWHYRPEAVRMRSAAAKRLRELGV